MGATSGSEALASAVGRELSREEKKKGAVRESCSRVIGECVRRAHICHGGRAISAALRDARAADPSIPDVYGGADEGADLDLMVPAREGEDRPVSFAREAASRLRSSPAVTSAHFQPALHGKTSTVKADGVTVLDATSVPRSYLEELARLSESERRGPPGGGLPCRAAPVVYLKMSCHLELSNPRGHVRRWGKVFDRLQMLYRAFPLTEAPAPCPRAGAGLPDEAYRACCGDGTRLAVLRACLRIPGLVVVGAVAAEVMSGVPLPPSVGWCALEVVSADPAGASGSLDRALEEGGVLPRGGGGSISTPEGVFLPAAVTRLLGGEALYRVYACPEHGLSSTFHRGVCFGTSDLVLRYMYGAYMICPDARVRLQGLINLVAGLQAGSCASPPLERFTPSEIGWGPGGWGVPAVL